MAKKEVPEGIMRSIMNLDAEGKKTLLGELKVLIAKDMAGQRADEGHPCCPRCGGTWVVKKGKTKRGRQRWFCRGCKRSFGETTDSIIGLSKLPIETWMAYAEGMAEHRTLRELADRCGVCLKTSWHVRMRICEAMGRHLDAFVSGPDVSVEVDGTVLHESLKGNNDRGCFVMPRKAHESGDSLHVRGVSGQLVNVVFAVNDRGGVIARIMGRAHGSAELIRDCLSDVLEPGTHVATDGLAAYAAVLEELGCVHEVRPSKPKQGERSLGMVNAAHRRFDDWMRPFNGVATRRLQRYIWWHVWEVQFRASDARWDELTTREAMTGTYEARVSTIFNEPRFSMSYWEERGWQIA